MHKSTFLNPNKIRKILLNDFIKNNYIVYKTKKWYRKEGIYDYGYYAGTKEEWLEIHKNYFINSSNEVYTKPCITIILDTNHEMIFYYDSFQEAENNLNILLNDIRAGHAIIDLNRIIVNTNNND